MLSLQAHGPVGLFVCACVAVGTRCAEPNRRLSARQRREMSHFPQSCWSDTSFFLTFEERLQNENCFCSNTQEKNVIRAFFENASQMESFIHLLIRLIYLLNNYSQISPSPVSGPMVLVTAQYCLRDYNNQILSPRLRPTISHCSRHKGHTPHCCVVQVLSDSRCSIRGLINYFIA